MMMSVCAATTPAAIAALALVLIDTSVGVGGSRFIRGLVHVAIPIAADAAARRTACGSVTIFVSVAPYETLLGSNRAR